MRRTRDARKRVLALIGLIGLASSVQGQTAKNGDALERGFENPPQSARPRVWWHWMNGNITKEEAYPAKKQTSCG